MIPKKDKTRSVDTEPDFMTELTNSVIRRKANKERRTRNFADAIIADAKQKHMNDTMGLRSILLADASNKPPTLEDYVKLGLSLSQLSQSERESIQFMLDKLNPKPEDKK
mgnify:FL=1